MSRGTRWPDIVEMRRDESGNRRMWASEHDLYLKRLREWRRAVRRMAKRSVEVVREKMNWRLVALTAVTILASIYYVQWLQPPKADPSFLEAQRIVIDYELGKAPEHIDYHNPVYQRALLLLSEVGDDSVSLWEARDLRTEITRSMDRFERRRREENKRIELARRAEAARERSLEAQQRFTTGVGKYAVFAHECEEELEQFEARRDALEELQGPGE
jgi:hypothetical protein